MLTVKQMNKSLKEHISLLSHELEPGGVPEEEMWVSVVDETGPALGSKVHL